MFGDRAFLSGCTGTVVATECERQSGDPLKLPPKIPEALPGRERPGYHRQRQTSDRNRRGLKGDMAVQRDLPTGTVTFLFSDIEGSTRLLKQLGREQYGALLG